MTIYATIDESEKIKKFLTKMKIKYEYQEEFNDAIFTLEKVTKRQERKIDEFINSI